MNCPGPRQARWLTTGRPLLLPAPHPAYPMIDPPRPFLVLVAHCAAQGMHHGWALGRELGVYRGCLRVWMALNRSESLPLPERSVVQGG